MQILNVNFYVKKVDGKEDTRHENKLIPWYEFVASKEVRPEHQVGDGMNLSPCEKEEDGKYFLLCFVCCMTCQNLVTNMIARREGQP